MIDYVKAEVYGCSPVDWTNISHLEFKGSHSTRTGLIDHKKIANYFNLKFIIYDSGRMYIAGSLHKYYNFLQNISAPNQHNNKQREKGFNGNQFSYTQLSFVLNDLRSKFKIDLNQSILRNIEFGLNISHHFDTEKILENLMLHKGREFNKPLSVSFREATHSQHWIKCYNKSLQYGMKDNLLRFEIKYKKMKQINDLGIIYLSDLKNRNLLKKVKRELLKRWNEILFYDYTITENQLNENEKLLIMNFKNPLFWKGIKSNHLDRPKKRYYELESKYSEQLKEKLHHLINENWETLNKRCVTFDRFFKEESNNCVIIDHSTIGSTLTHQIIKENQYNLNTLNNIKITRYGI